MEPCAELEITLHRRGGEGEYSASFRFSQPGSVVSTRFGAGGPAPVRLDLIELRGLALDLDAYAAALTGRFFADPRVAQNFFQACTAAGGVLRVRLAFDADAQELQGLYWELLRDPRDGSPLFTGENVVFSRYLSSPVIRPVRPHAREDLQALVFIANPSGLAKQRLEPIDGQGEYDRAVQGLGAIPARLYRDGPATLEGLIQALRAERPTILYLVCHGRMVRDEPYLLLEDETGGPAIVPGRDLVSCIKDLESPPLLVVLASCQSAGGGYAGSESAGDARAALGPRLAEAGVPAVVAMQGSVSMETVAKFMPVFFSELCQDGQVEKAMAVARGAVRGQPDFWMPVLFTCLVSGSLFAEPAAPARRQSAWKAWTGAALAVIVLLAGGWWQFFAVHPMQDYGIAVAEFAVLAEDGAAAPPGLGLEISQGIFETVEAALDGLPAALRYETRGPRKIGVIPGQDPAERAANAQAAAQRWGAGILVYGVVRSTGSGWQVEPAFYINDYDYQYGSDVNGAERLGAPVPVDPNEEFTRNQALHQRIKVLQNLVMGLANYSQDRYDLAAGYFQQAVYLDGWPGEQGKEVAYHLLGSAYLRTYDPYHPERKPIEPAREAFEQALRINPEFARAYIGMSVTAVVQATRTNPRQAALLYEARDWLLTGLEKKDQTEAGYMRIKATYQMGEITLLGSAQGFPTFANEDAAGYFRQVLAGYEQAGRPRQLAWHAGNSHLMLGRLSGLEEDWPGMRSECAQALEELNRLQADAPAIALAKARVHYNIGWTEEELGNRAAAREAYERAIELGRGAAAEQEMQEWQDQLDELDGRTSRYEQKHQTVFAL